MGVNARFNRDPVFSLGLVSVLDLLLKNYPEKDIARAIKTSLIESVGLVEADVDTEAANAVKEDEWWMYSRFFGVGLVRIMEIVGVEMDMSVAYDVMEDWVGNCLGKPFYTACS